MTQLASMGGDTAADQERPSASGPTVPPEPYELADAADRLTRTPCGPWTHGGEQPITSGWARST
jgi:hypothetical protein